MRQLGVMAAVALLAGSAAGQSGSFGSLGPPGSTNNLPAAMPGQVVGTGVTLNPAGTQIARAVPARDDIKKLDNPLMRPYDPSKPFDVFKGTNLDPTSVVAPVPGFPMTGQDPNLLQRLYTKIGTVTGFITPSTPVPRPTYTPGLSRRNKERAMERTWRRD
jgi:hypothetical protein